MSERWMPYEEAKARQEFYAKRRFEVIKKMAQEKKLTGLSMLLVWDLPEEQRKEILEILNGNTDE